MNSVRRNVNSDTPDVLWRLMDIADAGSGAAFIYKDNVIVAANAVGMSLYSVDWSGKVTFDDCYWNGIKNKNNTDPMILGDPAWFLEFAKEYRARTPNYRFIRKYGEAGNNYDRHHVGISREWNAQVWFPILENDGIGFTITTDTKPSDVRQYLAREKAISRLTSFLDGSGIAIAIIDWTGVILDSTLPMMRLLCRGQVLRLGDDDRIEANNSKTTAKLRSLATEISNGMRNAALLPLPLPDGSHTLAALIGCGPTDPAVIIAVAARENAEALEALLSDAFQLPPPATAVAIQIAAGQTPDSIADLTGRSIHTIRTHLATAKREMGVSRQHDLAALVTRAALLVGGSPLTKNDGE